MSRAPLHSETKGETELTNTRTPLVPAPIAPPLGASGGAASASGASESDASPSGRRRRHNDGRRRNGAAGGTAAPTAEETAQSDLARTSLKYAMALCLVFMTIEFFAGLASNSLAIMSDAAHMLTDVASLALALFAVAASQWAASEAFTFGFKRAEVVGALLSVVLVWVLVGAILLEAVTRLYDYWHCARLAAAAVTPESVLGDCEAVNPRIMLVVGVLGLLSNFAVGAVLYWGGAEVQHAHSHGEGSGHDHDHGHSHDGGGGCGGEAKRIRCCDPSFYERTCPEPNLHSPGGRPVNRRASPAAAARPSSDHGHSHDHGHDHGQGHDDDHDDHHGHSHDDHGHDHGAHGHDDHDDHGHGHDDHGDHGHAHGGHGHDDHDDHGHSHDDHGHSHDDHGHAHDDHGESKESGEVDMWFGVTNLNMRGAIMHALGDALQSVGVIIAASLIWYGAGGDPVRGSYYNLLDPAVSLLFAVITLYATKGLFLDVINILMEGAPPGVHAECVRSKLAHLPGVLDVGDLRMWCITSDRRAIAVHLVADTSSDMTIQQVDDLLHEARMLCESLGFSLSTIEIDHCGGEHLSDTRVRAGDSVAVPVPHSHSH